MKDYTNTCACGYESVPFPSYVEARKDAWEHLKSCKHTAPEIYIDRFCGEEGEMDGWYRVVRKPRR